MSDTFEHYDAQTQAVLTKMANGIRQIIRMNDPELCALVAYMAMHDALITPYVDEEHKGGNLIDLVMTLAAENHRLKNRL